MEKFISRNEGIIEDSYGKVIYYDVDRFIKKIVKSENCFICGAVPGSKQFNNEHILPAWLQRKLKLSNHKITLPNGILFPYSKYKIPCCEQCNSEMGEQIEKPIQALIEGGAEAVNKHLETNGSRLILNWLCLMFLKTHLKDRNFRSDLDVRKDNGKIADRYDFERLHHIHCIARSFYTGAIWNPPFLGTLFVFPAKTENQITESFDYCDQFFPQTILVRIDTVSFVAVLSDACAVLSQFRETLKKLKGPLSSVQLREIFAIFSYLSTQLKVRPKFKSCFDSEEYSITSSHPDTVEFNKFDAKLFGRYQHYLCKDLIRGSVNEKEIEEGLISGSWSFLFDDKGEFFKDSFRFI